MLSALDERPDRSARNGTHRRPAGRARSSCINIGFGRAAASLSKLTGHRVLLEVPQVTMCPIDELGDRAAADGRERRGERPPDLSGPVAGDALLMLDQQQRRDSEGAADQRAGAAADDRRLGARSDHRGRQHPAQRLPRHVRQHAQGAGVVLGAAPDARNAGGRGRARSRSTAKGCATR